MASRKQQNAAVSPERMEEIRASIEEGKGRSMFDNPTEDMDRFHGAMCRCGLYRKPGGLAKHVVDDGSCVVHADKTPEPGFREHRGVAPEQSPR